ncbi:AzlD family protein [Marinivivus vitaminiproducens]|uniref:AzlD family protein n=1 Tax=Marinivivus vitaminiproducens TaxID=3035935 RepID=UPI0027992430|nr:AzlD domain-containing protein [Geminicoccaceae bacterium SCSIO 64248]
MSLEPVTVAAILGMAVATYLTRIGGYWLVGRFTLGPRAQAALDAVPGAVLIAVIAPTALATGWPETAAAAVAALAALRLPLLAAVALSVVTVALLRLV